MGFLYFCTIPYRPIAQTIRVHVRAGADVFCNFLRQRFYAAVIVFLRTVTGHCGSLKNEVAAHTPSCGILNLIDSCTAVTVIVHWCENTLRFVFRNDEKFRFFTVPTCNAT